MGTSSALSTTVAASLFNDGQEEPNAPRVGRQVSEDPAERTELGEIGRNVLIRDFEKSDLSDLLDLLPKCFAREFEVTGFDPAHVTDMVNSAFGTTGRLFLGLLRLVQKEPIKFLVADADGKVVGTTIVNSRGKVGYIQTVMVHPDYRRRGIATRLMKKAIAYVQERRMRRAVLHVDSTNTAAIGVYIKMGFKPFERMAYLVGEAVSPSASEDTSAIKTRPFRNEDLDRVYNLITASEDPNHMRVFDFNKNNLKTSLMEALFHFSTQKKLVAEVDGKIVGYAETSYTTPKEAGRISSIHAVGQDGSSEIERVLVLAGIGEIRKGGVNRIRVTVASTKKELIETLKNLGFIESLVMEGMFTEV